MLTIIARVSDIAWRAPPTAGMMAALRYRYLGMCTGTHRASEHYRNATRAEDPLGGRLKLSRKSRLWIVFGRARSRGSAAAPVRLCRLPVRRGYQALLGRGAGGAVPIARRLGSRRSPNALHRAGQPRERPVSLPTAGQPRHTKMATRRQRAKQRQPQPPEPAADYEHIGVVLRLRPLLRWERREGFHCSEEGGKNGRMGKRYFGDFRGCA